MRRPFTSREEVAAYLSGDTLECLECGRRFWTLGRHLRRTHSLAPEDYRARWGLPASTPLAGQGYRQARSVVARRLIAEGTLIPNAAAACEAAREAGRGVRADWERAEQAERAARIPHPTLPPGARRADGRDADRARAYQRSYRGRRHDP